MCLDMESPGIPQIWNLTKDEKVMVKHLNFGQELLEKQTDKFSYGGALNSNREFSLIEDMKDIVLLICVKL